MALRLSRIGGWPGRTPAHCLPEGAESRKRGCDKKYFAGRLRAARHCGMSPARAICVRNYSL
jgi:hypothetical protein